ncbi:MAG TPA: di-heme oxidoredictase family protein [Pirellulales bacterium]|nr:di-heme oxidoredictase family protein [Pirellulales bacterium]
MCHSVCASLVGARNLGIAGLGFVLLFVACFSPVHDALGDDEPAVSEQAPDGQELFLRQWKTSHDPLQTVNDGLGPMFNAASCVKCHQLGGVGGAGGNEDNVDLLTIKVKRKGVVARGDLSQRVAAFHPALATAGRLSATTVLHRFSLDPNYDAWRRRFLTSGQQAEFPITGIVDLTTAASQHPFKAPNPVQRLDGMAYQHSQRNTPALFGAGMIDGLPDAVFDEMEVRQAAQGGSVSGRVPRTAGGRVGRFGWRGQTQTLHEFVLGACAVELGLESPGHSQPIDPLKPHVDENGRPLRAAKPGLDITEEQCKSLTQFVANLPRPQQSIPTDHAEAERVAKGEERFERIGCSNCHVRQVAFINGIYSDLLLHDMGSGLEDPVPANPAKGATDAVASYYGPDALLANVSPEQRREWRTPPLWGVRESAPYLHDGRAQTFSEAIAWHGGEAAQSAREFRRLAKAEQEEILTFLDSLAAPTPEETATEEVVLRGSD